MPLFQLNGKALTSVEQTNFDQEKQLQQLVENNLKVIFNCRFIATEYSTGAVHSGRIDTLALSEDNNPVIIEYKKVESSELVTQSLYYLHWIRDHKGDFERAAQKALGHDIKVDWSDVRVICIAPNYRKFDLHAVQVMGANIELWRYRRFTNGALYLEDVFQATRMTDVVAEEGKNPIMVEAGKKAARTRANASYKYEDHLKDKSPAIQQLIEEIREFILTMDPAIEEVPKKLYIAYKISQNIVCLEPQARVVKLFLKLSANEVLNPPKFYRDVTKIGHYGTGDSEFTLTSGKDLEIAMPFILKAYNKVGG